MFLTVLRDGEILRELISNATPVVGGQKGVMIGSLAMDSHPTASPCS